MKACFEKAGVKVAPYILIKDFESLEKFAEENGYPVFVKPDIGVGAEESFKISNFDELKAFYDKKQANVQYICERFVPGDIVTFDGVADINSEVVFYASLECPPSISDILQQGKDFFYYINPFLDPEFEKLGRATIKAFHARKRFFHIEYFRVTQARKGLFKVGDIVGLEINIRSPGGYSPDMQNFANSIDVYDLYGQVMADQHPVVTMSPKYYLPTASRRDGVEYFYSDEDVLRTYKNNICNVGRYPKVFSGVMGDRFFMAKFDNVKDVMTFRDYANRRVDYHSSSSAAGAKFNKVDDGDNICDTHIDGA